MYNLDVTTGADGEAIIHAVTGCSLSWWGITECSCGSGFTNSCTTCCNPNTPTVPRLCLPPKLTPSTPPLMQYVVSAWVYLDTHFHAVSGYVSPEEAAITLMQDHHHLVKHTRLADTCILELLSSFLQCSPYVCLTFNDTASSLPLLKLTACGWVERVAACSVPVHQAVWVGEAVMCAFVGKPVPAKMTQVWVTNRHHIPTLLNHFRCVLGSRLIVGAQSNGVIVCVVRGETCHLYLRHVPRHSMSSELMKVTPDVAQMLWDGHQHLVTRTAACSRALMSGSSVHPPNSGSAHIAARAGYNVIGCAVAPFAAHDWDKEPVNECLADDAWRWYMLSVHQCVMVSATADTDALVVDFCTGSDVDSQGRTVPAWLFERPPVPVVSLSVLETADGSESQEPQHHPYHQLTLVDLVYNEWYPGATGVVAATRLLASPTPPPAAAWSAPGCGTTFHWVHVEPGSRFNRAVAHVVNQFRVHITHVGPPRLPDDNSDSVNGVWSGAWIPVSLQRSRLVHGMSQGVLYCLPLHCRITGTLWFRGDTVRDGKGWLWPVFVMYETMVTPA